MSHRSENGSAPSRMGHPPPPRVLKPNDSYSEQFGWFGPAFLACLALPRYSMRRAAPRNISQQQTRTHVLTLLSNANNHLRCVRTPHSEIAQRCEYSSSEIRDRYLLKLWGHFSAPRPVKHTLISIVVRTKAWRRFEIMMRRG